MHQPFQRLLHGTLALRIQRAGGLVEQQYRRVLEQGAGDGDALLLAAGQACTAFAELAVEASRQFADEVVRFGGLGGRMHSEEEALAIVDAFVAQPWSEEERHQRRIDILAEYEKTGIAPALPEQE